HPVQQPVHVDPVDRFLEVDPSQDGVQVHLGQYRVQVDPGQHFVDLDPVDRFLDIDPSEHGVQVDPGQYRVQVDRVHHQGDHAFREVLGRRFHLRGEPPAYRAQPCQRIHVIKYRGNSAFVATTKGEPAAREYIAAAHEGPGRAMPRANVDRLQAAIKGSK